MTRKTVVVFTCVLAAILGPLAGCAAAATNLLAEAKWQYSVDGGKSWTAADAPPALTKETRATILARAELTAGDLAKVVCWELDAGGGYGQRISHQLNGKPVPVPLEGMEYRTIGAIPAETIQAGKNVLTVKVEYQGKRAGGRPLRLPKTLIALTEQDLKIVSGPVLGAITNNAFTVTCRTNMPATVTLTVTETGWVSNWQPAAPRVSTHTSGAGLFHRFRVGKHAMADKLTYQLRATSGEQSAETKARAITLPVFGMKGRDKGQLRFAVTGDSRSRTDDWAAVAAAVLKARPDLFVFTGDMNDHGTNDWEWDEHYLGPESARELLATVPYLPVKGNHEENAPLIPELFHTPGADGKAENWAVEVGSALLIGINGAWSAEWGRTAKWLDRTMAESKAKFIFLTTHYPGWSSAGNGKLDARGRPTHWGYRNVRGTVVPLLRKHKACAYLAAHEHHYERSDLPGGLYQIIAAGAGAPRSSKVPEAARQNPYAKVFVEGLNFCIFEVEGDACTMKALSPDGKVLDTLTWRARKPD